MNGKQHGRGKYKKAGEEEEREGIWEEGKRIKWID